MTTALPNLERLIAPRHEDAQAHGNGWTGMNPPSHLYLRIAEKLAPHGITPGEYARQARAAGASWTAIRSALIGDLAIGVSPQTIEFWAHVDWTPMPT